jgi:hypothetical protein
MSTYWNQWSHAEVMSMHGLELDEIGIDLCQDEEETEVTDNCLGISLDSLGMSWRDFF